MYIELILNLGLLVAISVVSGFVSKRWSSGSRTAAIIQGALFGAAAVFGMMKPLILGPGLIFDGRSVMLSLCALFFGPWAAAPSVLMAMACRLWLGGGGALMGVLVILSSAGLGLFCHFRWRPQSEPPSTWMLYMFGIAVHLVMVGLIFTLPYDTALSVLKNIGLPVMLLYPLATILIGKILSDQESSFRFMEKLQASEKKYKELVENANSIILRWDNFGSITFMNEYALNFFGYSHGEIIGQSVVGTIVPRLDSSGKDLSHMILDISSHPERYKNNENENMRKDGTRVYVVWTNKPIMDDHGKCIGILCVGNDITERKRVEEELKKSEERLSIALEVGNAGVWEWYRERKEVRFDSRFHAMLGYVPGELPTADQEWVNTQHHHPDDLPLMLSRVESYLRGDTPVYESEHRIRNKSGTWTWVFTRGKLFSLTPSGNKEMFLGIAMDITERKLAEEGNIKLETQLRQSQKMEAVGQLAGGVAHDFNNMLSVINGYSDMMLVEMSTADPNYERIKEIHKAGLRSSELTQQLLAFARKQTIAPKVIDWNDTVVGMLKMLQRLIGENIELVLKPAATPLRVKMDPAQVNQILANLIVNARDAVSVAGKIEIETGREELDEIFCGTHPDCVPGKYVVLSVSDNGCGMGRETLDHIFEPFFTTKKVGKGTGLGLATVFGIVKQNKGFIDVCSEIGKGTTFKIYLPMHEPVDGAKEKETGKARIFSGIETILLVEDEESLLQFAKRLLEQLGYTVLPASSPGQAIMIAGEYKGEIHLLMTDVIMPEMSGRDLRERISSMRSNIKCLYMSGYTADIIAQKGVLDEGIHFLEKPFTAEALSAKLREALS